MVVAPHHLASEAAVRVLREGGNAVEAVVAAAATLAVVYPHMTGIGGDGFWLIAEPGRPPVAVDACGGAGSPVDSAFYRSRGLAEVPRRGPLAANTVAGTVSGWSEALSIAGDWSTPLPLSCLLEDARYHAAHGFAVTRSQAAATAAKRTELQDLPGFAQLFLNAGAPYAEGTRLKLPALADTLEDLSRHGLDGFYRGDLARRIAADLARAGAPVTASDLARHMAQRRKPLSLRLTGAEAFNLPPPTQGIASLLILGLFERLKVHEADSFAHVHALVEATKRAFLVRDRIVADPAAMNERAEDYLTADWLDRTAADIDPARALPWPAPATGGDTVWIGVIDGQGRAVSFIQSLYFEFGSGIVLNDTGIVWQNRGTAFRLDGPERLAPAPGRKPFHTLNPALIRFDDGRTVVYGTMGGEGQPQTQAAILTRYLLGATPQEAVTAPRWLLGRTWGDDSVSLKLEDRFAPEMFARLADAGHAVEPVPAFSDLMGHAGMIVRRPDGMLEGAGDPRGDGAAWGY